ncbi:MAG: hypothetical protein GY856_55470, partial [bacterium]|nr:hypothetical protein [bacterium]
IGYHASGVDAQLARLAALGADAVSVMPFGYQPIPDEPQLRFLNQSPVAETDVGVVYAARRAHAHGFRVLWKPHLWVSHASWPGEIEMRNPADWAAWWRAYRRYVVHHAVLAAWSESEMFSIGVELGRTLGHEAEWNRVVEAVRRVYPGIVTYAGNWWEDFDRAPFWDRLDAVGVDAYFPLAGADADRATLAAGAERVVAQLERAAARFGKPILLTEVGFAARVGAWVEPHREGGELSEAHQELAYEVLLETLGKPSWLAGVFLWKAFSHPSVERRAGPDFVFLGRRAEAAVGTYFAGGAAPQPQSEGAP